MSQAEYRAWSRRAVADYASARAAGTGETPDHALAAAEEQHARFLPGGLDTPGTWLMTVEDEDGRAVGMLWLGPHPDRPDAAWVFDVQIQPPHRGRGLGRAAMLAAEELSRGNGIGQIGLNVFGNNAPARALYDSLGYGTVSIQMGKAL